MSLKAKATGAAFWSIVDRVAQYGFQSLVSILLARLLLPTEVGLIGMLWIFISLVGIFSDAGFSPTLLQKQDATEVDECSVFYFNIVFSLMGAAVIWIAAPWIAVFYKLPELSSVARGVSLSLPFTAFGLIHTVTLNKRLDIKTQAKAGLVSAVCSGIVAVTMAVYGFGVWSLVGQILTQSLVRTLALWHYSPWRPKLIFSYASLRGMFPFGVRVLASAFMNAIFDNFYPAAIGKLFSPLQLGYYTLANRIPQMFSSSLTSIVSRVSTPLYPTLRSQPELFKKALRRAMAMMTIVNTPILIGIAVTAEAFVTALLTPKWLPAIPYLRMICMIMIMSPFHYGNLDATLGLGKADLYLRFGLIHKVLSVVNVIVSFHGGIMGLLVGEFVVTFLTCTIQAYYVGRHVGYPFSEQLADLSPGILVSVAMGVIVQLAVYVHLHSAALNLALQVTVGVVSFVALCKIFRVKAFDDIVDFAAHLKKRPAAAAIG